MTRTFAARDGTILDLDDRGGIVRYVSEKLAAQGERCMDGWSCAFRSQDGTKACAAGWLIPDDLTEDPNFVNDTGFIGLVSQCKAVHDHFPGLTYEDQNFIARLQSVHDHNFNWEKGISETYAEVFSNVLAVKEGAE